MMIINCFDNSGAEANENALKLASFYNGRNRVLSFCKAFHGRTSLAVEVTHNPKIIAPINDNGHVTYLPLNDIEAAKAELAKGDVCAVIIEGIQGVGGIQVPEVKFLKELSKACEEVDAALVLDEIQSGYGRSGKFFAHQTCRYPSRYDYGCKGDWQWLSDGWCPDQSEIQAGIWTIGNHFWW